MELVVKKKSYEVVEEVNEYLAVVESEGKKYVVYHFADKNNFDNFKFAVKRLKSCGLAMPEVYDIDKKNFTALVEYIDGISPFDKLREEDLPESIIEQLFNLNYRARVNKIRLDFDPENFVIHDDTLYYMPFTFSEYTRETDFTQKEIYLWYYTNEFVAVLKQRGLPIQKDRLINSFDRNKQIVLQVVKYFR